RTALNNGQVDAIWVPEPFLSQGLNLDGDRIVMAPGPTVGKFFPNGGYAALQSWAASNPSLARRFRTALNQSLTYAQTHTDEIRAMLPAGSQNSRLAIWSTLVDRGQLAQLAPASIASGLTIQGTVASGVTLKLDGKPFKTLNAGKYAFVVNDRSKANNFHLRGPGVNRSTSVPRTGTSTFVVTLAKGTYTYGSDGKASKKGSFKVA